ncbi:MAG: UDP-2,3-diacylglucosamine diphosphatase LpxI [Rhodobacteraceae bacterium]|nr:UDP-2,3-diacylglucosamine diphosphatase LpxI [Paracoccaceae bacterium]
MLKPGPDAICLSRSRPEDPIIDHNQTILIAGRGRLPAVLAERLLAAGTPLTVLSLPGSDQSWPPAIQSGEISLANWMQVLAGKRAEGWTRAVMAGGVGRPPAPEDCSCPVDFSGGDDDVLRQFIVCMEDEIGLTIVSAVEIAPDLVAHSGLLTARAPTGQDRQDIRQGFQHARAHGMHDAGQAAVVARRKCLGLEPAAGTDALLKSVAETLAWPGPPARRRGVLAKCRKPIQDHRIDIPTVGPSTVELAAAIGLAGIAIRSGEVILLDRELSIRCADAHGLFIWSEKVSS